MKNKESKPQKETKVNNLSLLGTGTDNIESASAFPIKAHILK